jgi:hypothetical protein
MSDKLQLLNAGFAAWVSRKSTNVKVKGTEKEIAVIGEALRASRRFRDTLIKEGVKLDEVLECLEEKKSAARKFESTLGYPWPL